MLMGKNLAVLPFALAMMVVMVGLQQWLNPMRFDHLVALLFQVVSMYLLFCLAANLLSIIAPIALKPGSGMPAGHQGIRSFGPLLFMMVAPVLLGLTLGPLGFGEVTSPLDRPDRRLDVDVVVDAKNHPLLHLSHRRQELAAIAFDLASHLR
jgi:hypothetical protein